MIVINAKLVFTEDLLGTANSNPKIHSDYIASKAPDALSKEEEVLCIGAEAVEEKQKTIFHRDADGNPLLWNYQFTGMLKNHYTLLRRCTGEEFAKNCCKLAAGIKILNENVHVYPRKIPIHLAGEIGNLQRPLRASGPQGERVALANSETVPAGSWVKIRIECDAPKVYEAIIEMLKYGERAGMGQWRNGGYGTFEIADLEVLEVERSIDIPEPKKVKEA